MTLQTAEPFDHISLNPTHVTLGELVRRIEGGMLDLDPPYQRGDVWTVDQRMALVQSWLRGLPAGVVILADRCNDRWQKAHGGRGPYETGEALWACVDGKQRFTTALMWRTDGFAVPASWLDPRNVDTTEDTDDGPYVRFSGLSAAGQRFVERYCSLLIAEAKECATVEEEAELYLLVNGGGTPQTNESMANAIRVAEGN
ncbi:MULTISPECIES: DUF262 domain-containing protein [unclassified Streptomyces]|uniref:DUF262 domain-containing protein n=1 Tax=unclassified Streptomyces TaxID=2593676 RepID=UPI0033247046